MLLYVQSCSILVLIEATLSILHVERFSTIWWKWRATCTGRWWCQHAQLCCWILFLVSIVKHSIWKKKTKLLLLFTCITIQYYFRETNATEFWNFSSNFWSIEAFFISMSSFSAFSLWFSIRNLSSSSFILLLSYVFEFFFLNNFSFCFLEGGRSDDTVNEEAKFDVEGRNPFSCWFRVKGITALQSLLCFFLQLFRSK